MSGRNFWAAVGLLWLAGIALRLPILAVPPVVALIQADLQLSGTEVGILSGLPVVLFGLAALPGWLMIARFGALATLVIGLVAAGVASGLRGAVLDMWLLFAATAVMSAAIAIVQPALPVLVRQWLPQRVSFATAVYTNGLLVGETLAVMLTIPLVLPLADGSWRWGLAIWSLPPLVIAVLVVALAPPLQPIALSVPAQSRGPGSSNPLIWQFGILFGSVNSVYFSSNAFLPGYLTGVGRQDLIGGALTALNFGQIPASFVLLAFVRRLERRAWPFIFCGALILLCLAGIVTTASAWTVMFAGLLGFFGAVAFTLGLTLPPLLSAPADLARVSAAMFTISYSEGLLVSVLAGAAWDLAGTPRYAFLPIALGVLPLIAMPATIRFQRAPGATPV